MKPLLENLKSFWLAALIFSFGRATNGFANPTGLNVIAGGATAQALGSQLNVSVSQMAILNWQTFNIQNGETTAFLQPSANSVVFNLIGDKNPSQIFGNLNANGTVILANANGFYFGPNSMIKVGGSFVATTAPLPPDLGSGGMWSFTGTPPLASIVNYGKIEVGNGKSLYLIAENIENHGTLNAPAGDIELAAGAEVLMSDNADGRGLSAAVKLPAGSVDNFGRITANAGTIAIEAKVVNQDGIIQADSIAERNGVIELVASDQLKLGANSQILARGDDSLNGSAGGNITLKSDNVFSDAAGGQIVATGGAHGGNGGKVEISAPNIQSLDSTLDGSAQAGFTDGQLLLDPTTIILGTANANGSLNGSGTVVYNSAPGVLNLNVSAGKSFKNFSQILLQATGNIYVGNGTVNNGVFSFAATPGITWNLSTSTGQTVGQLTLEAGGDIVFGNKSQIIDPDDWRVSLYAGYNFNTGLVQSSPSGLGNIYLNGGSGLTTAGTIQLATGDINLFAAQNILVAPNGSGAVSGSIYTTGGGNIFAYAQAGDINAGTYNGGIGSKQTTDYNFTVDGYSVNSVLGGISTAAGGNVTLIAGHNIDSTPRPPSGQAPGASGTYGAGNVTLIAGNQITGNYNLAEGVGTILAGAQVPAGQLGILQNPGADATAYASTLAGLMNAVKQSQSGKGDIGVAPVAGAASTSPVTLGVIKGTWNAWAANDISLKEVINPNGAFNRQQGYIYDYAADAAANFWAGNAIELVGGSFPLGASSVNLTPIYAPVLSLDAGAGGITLDHKIILAPSAQGALTLITRNGGNLTGPLTAGSTVLNGIIMSDSGSADYTTFSAEHDNIHLHDPNVQNNPKFKPVFVDIDGSIGNFSLTVPTFADITVRGHAPFASPDGNVFGTYNFSFLGRNLAASQTTSINVLGEITYRGVLSAITLTGAQLNDLLPAQLFTDSANPDVTSKLIYDPTTQKLIFVGVMNQTDLTFLLAPSVFVLDKNGNPVNTIVLDGDGNPQIVPLTQPLPLDGTQKALINALYTASQTASLGSQGIVLAGPGNFNVSATTMNLGVSGGILAAAPDAGLAAISPYGATLNVTTIGDLAMTSTGIANEGFRGDLNVNVGGTLDAGGQFTALGNAAVPKGIFTTSGGNISVIADGNLNVSGARIAAYNGGNVFAESLHGDVNAGTGSASSVGLTALELEPVSGTLISIPATIPLSGIFSTTVPGSHAALGDITIKAPEGSLNASLGGVLQIAFNDANTKNNFIDVDVGKDINANGSGIIGSNIRLKAGGDINGAIIGKSSVNIDAQHNVDVTAVSGGSVNIGAGGSVAGTIVGGGDVNVSGDAISAAVEGGTVSTSGNTAGASLGVPASNVAKDVAQTADDANTTTRKSDDNADDELNKKKKGISLAQKVSRVTVLLPTKN